MKIKIMSIQDLLRIPHLKSSFKHAIIFVTMNPNYYDFGCTKFIHLYIADTNIPKSKSNARITLENSGRGITSSDI